MYKALNGLGPANITNSLSFHNASGPLQVSAIMEFPAQGCTTVENRFIQHVYNCLISFLFYSYFICLWYLLLTCTYSTVLHIFVIAIWCLSYLLLIWLWSFITHLFMSLKLHSQYERCYIKSLWFMVTYICYTLYIFILVLLVLLLHQNYWQSTCSQYCCTVFISDRSEGLYHMIFIIRILTL